MRAGYRRSTVVLLLSLLYSSSMLCVPQKSQAIELRGDLSLQGFLFLSDPAWKGQEDHSASIAGNIEFYHDFQNTLSFTLEGFYRQDSQDRERSHGDLRLAEFLYYNEHVEIKTGLGRVFWGATEFVHLVDIINQTDQVDALDGEEKFGQPMVHVSVPGDWGVVEAFALPWFRERNFPGVEGRFRTPIPVDTDKAQYESSSEEHHLDLALRYATALTSADIGLYFFRGTARDPVLRLSLDSPQAPTLYPYYHQINQSGLDVQLTAGDWLLKGEAYYRTGQSRSYAATTFGFEYTFTGIAESMMDIGLIGEYVFDDRDNSWLPTVYENDIMGGLRLAVNDMADSTLLLGVIRDLDSGSTIMAFEGSRRLGQRIRLNLDASFFIDMEYTDPAYAMAKDDFIKLEMVWYW